MLTPETLAAMLDEMMSIHKIAAQTAVNPFLPGDTPQGKRVQLGKVPGFKNSGPGITKSVENNLRKRRKITNLVSKTQYT